MVFSGCMTIFRDRVCLTPKMNIIFLITNKMLNTFLFGNFFKKSSIFRENRKKLFRSIWPFLWGKEPSYAKNYFTIFYWKLSNKYFIIKQFFQKNQYFPRKRQNPLFGVCVTFLKRRPASGDQNEYYFFYRKWNSEYFFINQLFWKRQYFTK